MLHRWDLFQPTPQLLSWRVKKSDDVGDIRRIVYSSRTKSIYTSDDHRVQRWDLLTGKAQAVYLSPELHLVEDMWLMPNQDALGIIRRQALVRLDLETLMAGEPLLNVGFAMVPARRGDWWIGLKDSGMVEVHRTPAPTALQRMQIDSEIDGEAQKLALRPDGRMVMLRAKSTQRVTLGELGTQNVLRSIPAPSGEILLDCTPDSRTLIIPRQDETHLYSFTRSLADSSPPYVNPLHAFALHPKGGWLAELAVPADNSSYREFSMWQLDARSNFIAPKPERSFAIELPDPGLITDQIAFTEAWPELAVTRSGHDKVLSEMIWLNAQTGQVNATSVIENNDRATALRLITGNRSLALFGNGLFTWTGRTPGPGWTNRFGNTLRGMSTLTGVDRMGDNLIVAGQDGALRVFEPKPKSWKMVQDTQIDKAPIWCLQMNNARQMALIGDDNGNLRLVQIPSMQVSQSIKAHQGRITALAMRESLIVSGGTDGQVRFWTWGDTGLTEIFSLHLDRALKQMEISPDGRSLWILCKGDRSVRRWDLAGLWDQFHHLKIAGELAPLSVSNFGVPLEMPKPPMPKLTPMPMSK